MTIRQEGSYYLDFDDSENVSTAIGIDSKNMVAVIKEAQDKYTSLFGHSSFGFKEDKLDFLNQLPETKKIWFWDVELSSVEGIYAPKNITELGVFGKYPSIDYSRLSSLKELIWHFRKKDKGILNLEKLELFHVWHVNPKEKTFRVVPIPKNINELQVIWANPICLDGIPQLLKLKNLELHRCRNLSSIDGIEKIAPNLERINIENSSKLTDFSPLKKLKKLKEAWFNDDELLLSKI